jgi:hypothetical protein
MSASRQVCSTMFAEDSAAKAGSFARFASKVVEKQAEMRLRATANRLRETSINTSNYICVQ